jgi:hypothetical protein
MKETKMLQEIKVTIKKDGTAVVTTTGASGKACTEVTEELELLLGKQVGEKEFTADYYKPQGPSTEAWITRSGN